MMAAVITLILTSLLRAGRTQHALVLENLALRHQLAILQRTARRPRLRPSDRVLWVLLARPLARLGRGPRHRATRHRHPLAARRLPARLDLDEPAARTRPPRGRPGGPRAHPPHGRGQPPMGRTPDSRQTPEARD